MATDNAPGRADRWSAAEDRYLVEHPNEPVRETALALGRTELAVRTRRRDLRRRGAMAATPAHVCRDCGADLTGSRAQRCDECKRRHRNAKQKAFDDARREQINAYQQRRRAEPGYTREKNRRFRERHPEVVAEGIVRYRVRVAAESARGPHRNARWVEADDEYVRNHPDMPSRELAAKLGRSVSAVNTRRQRLGLALPSGQARRKANADPA